MTQIRGRAAVRKRRDQELPIMKDRKTPESADLDALSHLRAHRVLVARRINEIALQIAELRTEVEALDKEIRSKVQQLEEVDRGISVLMSVHNLRARHAARFADAIRHQAAAATATDQDGPPAAERADS
ncbi:hypothetical protein [Mycobacterium sp. E3339]|uniref:hypothetical protein n=1 Tax=Mycobacterium sp. E3339 TaxID=1834146 RepID=UPI0007FC7058|nr:hypothetical protein [Mycobacterium sp. E3339]OBG60351.1 hypothetical protein A5702_04725 [Mycobacterium sp. E3339]